MLIRIVIENYYSFGNSKEFNMFPSPRYTRLSNHQYTFRDTKILKQAAIYGANASGKSNLIKAVNTLKNTILKEEIPSIYNGHKFKFNEDKDAPQVLGIEFIEQNQSFYYAIETNNKIVTREELYKSGLGKKDDMLIFERTTNEEQKTTIKFHDSFYSNEENVVLGKIIEKNLCKHNKPVFKLLTTFDNDDMGDIGIALHWFSDTLKIITPNSKVGALAHIIDTDNDFKKYFEDMFCSFDTGICSVVSRKKSLSSFFGEDNEDLDEIIKEVEDSESKLLALLPNKGPEINVVKEDDAYFVKYLKLEHKNKHGAVKQFDPDEESDGTLRLMDLVPAIKNVASDGKVIFIDEIERSIHPLLIKELIKKFSEDSKTNGQIIFTTHESHLLDQEIFRQDEIWFVEKDQNGCSDLYSLSDFKEHNTKDIRKGYLNGRYGSIPFLANLKDLNWHNYDNPK